jgi:predicted acetyltransferase
MAPGRDAEFAEMLDEFRASGELDVYRGVFATAWKGYAPFYELISKMKLGGYPEPNYVPMDAYFIESDGRILGEVYIRHQLTPRLEQVGGHIGYKVRPSRRNRGVATAALGLALKELDSMNIQKALVTCKAMNVASARVIEKCGGLRTTDAITPDGVEHRYWIPTLPNSAD